MNKAISKVCDDVLKTCDFLASAAALYFAAYTVESHVFGTDYLKNNWVGEVIGKFNGGKGPLKS